MTINLAILLLKFLVFSFINVKIEDRLLLSVEPQDNLLVLISLKVINRKHMQKILYIFSSELDTSSHLNSEALLSHIL